MSEIEIPTLGDEIKPNAEAIDIVNAAPASDADGPKPEEQAQTEQQERQTIEMYEGNAKMIVAAAAAGVQLKWGFIEYDEDTKANVAQKLAPVLRKWDVIPPWAARWAEEIELAIALGGVIGGTVIAVMAYNREQDGKESADQTPESQHSVHSADGGGEVASTHAEFGDPEAGRESHPVG